MQSTTGDSIRIDGKDFRFQGIFDLIKIMNKRMPSTKVFLDLSEDHLSKVPVYTSPSRQLALRLCQWGLESNEFDKKIQK